MHFFSSRCFFRRNSSLHALIFKLLSQDNCVTENVNFVPLGRGREGRSELLLFVSFVQGMIWLKITIFHCVFPTETSRKNNSFMSSI